MEVIVIGLISGGLLVGLGLIIGYVVRYLQCECKSDETEIVIVPTTGGGRTTRPSDDEEGSGEDRLDVVPR